MLKSESERFLNNFLKNNIPLFFVNLLKECWKKSFGISSTLYPIYPPMERSQSRPLLLSLRGPRLISWLNIYIKDGSQTTILGMWQQEWWVIFKGYVYSISIKYSNIVFRTIQMTWSCVRGYFLFVWMITKRDMKWGEMTEKCSEITVKV